MTKRRARKKNTGNTGPAPTVIRSERDAWQHMEKVARRLQDRDSTIHTARAAGVTIGVVSRTMLDQLHSGIHMNPRRKRGTRATRRNAPVAYAIVEATRSGWGLVQQVRGDPRTLRTPRANESILVLRVTAPVGTEIRTDGLARWSPRAASSSPSSPRYSAAAVEAAIASSRRSGRPISGKEAKSIHRLLKGWRGNPTVRDVPLRKGDYAIRVHQSHYSSLIGAEGAYPRVDVVQVMSADKHGRALTSKDVRSGAAYRQEFPWQDIWLKISDKAFRVPPWLPVNTPAELGALFDGADEALEGTEWIDTSVRNALVKYLRDKLKR